MAASKTTNISKQTKNVAQRDGKGSRKGRPPGMPMTAYKLGSVVVTFGYMCKHYNIRYEGLQLLILLNRNWVKNMRGISVTMLMRCFEWQSGNVYDMLFARLEDLIKRGLVEVVGKGRNNCNLYAPTVKASNDINGMMLMIEG